MLIEATCTDCDTAPTMTPQCTDQCVVVACTDAGHMYPTAQCDGMPCPGDHCHLGCEDGDNCRDCSKFDKFLECCTDFHSYYEEPRNHPESAWSWDPSLKTFVCNCGGGSTADSNPYSCVDFENDFQVVSDASSSTPSPRRDTVTSSAPLPLACMWGDCGVSFSSLSDLAEHVNVVHLCYPPAPSLPSSSDVRDLFSMSCQWKDCNIYPTPDSVPGPSSGDFESMLGVLASHLLHDHLGLNAPPNHFPAQSQLQSLEVLPHHESPHVTSHLADESASSVSVPSSQDEGQAEHVCGWVSCGQRFSSVDDLTLHLTSVHVGAGKASYDCYWNDCSRHGDSGFASKQKLCRHLQSHTGHRPFQCKICMQNFSEAATLQQHMRRHTQEKPYMCDHPGCGKSFAITGALTIHKRTHNGHRPFKCPHCEKAFSESSNLSKHLRTHTGAKPYSCPEPDCGKSFARADQLTRHARVHNK